jgi:hypothetical protein
MWIRDVLPRLLTGTRFMLYGYDTTLPDSKSFQVITDLAVSLINELKAIVGPLLTAKPLMFLTHSLGGVILKQALVMLAGSGETEKHILNMIKGAVFIGVPSQGMSISDIFEMLGKQPNTALVHHLSCQSDYLARLEQQFMGISYIRSMKLFWAYETTQTPSLSVS